MPRVTITGAPEERYNQDAEKVPFLKLAKGERSRIACLDVSAVGGRMVLSPVREYYHRLEAPQVVDGIAQREVRTNDKTGATTEDWVYDWVGNPICLGAQDTLMVKGIDPDNCPVCRAHLEEPKYVGGPVPYFAMNVVKYGTRHGSWEMAAPPSAAVIAWKFPSSRFDKLSDLAKEAPEGNLVMVDIKLGPCTDEGYQKYDIGVISGPPMWRASPEWTAYVQQMWNAPGNRATDEQLSALCGRKVANREWLDRDIAKCLQGWRIAMAQQHAASAPPGFQQQPFQQGMGQMAQAAQAFAGAAPLAPAPPAQAFAAPQAPQVPDPSQAFAFPAGAVAPPAPQFAIPPQPDMSQHPGGFAEFAPQPQFPMSGQGAPFPSPAANPSAAPVIPAVPSQAPAAPQAAPPVPQAVPVPQASAAIPQAPGVVPGAAPPPAGPVTTDQVPFSALTEGLPTTF